MPTIFYVCDVCELTAPDVCGYPDRRELRVMPNGAWWCQGCHHEIDAVDMGLDPDAEKPEWDTLPMPPEYKEATKAPGEWPWAEDGVAEIVKSYTAYINDTPGLLSLLYDIDMLPEQTVTRAGAVRLAAMCELWKRAESAEAAAPAPPPEGE